MRAVLVREAAAILGASPATLYSKRWRARVGLRAVRIGRSIRFMEADLHRLLEKGVERLPGAHGGRQ